MNKRLSTALVLTVSLIAPVLISAPAQAAESSFQIQCPYIFNGRCVEWYTGESTCYHIFEISSDDRKRRACAIWKSQGVVTVTAATRRG